MTSVMIVGNGGPEPEAILRHLSAAAGIETVEVVDSVAAVFDRARRGPPVVGLVEGDLSDLDGAAAPRGPNGNGSHVRGFIVVAPHAGIEDVGRALRVGAKGFLLADSPPEEVTTAVRAVAAGFLFVPSVFLQDLGETLLTISCRATLTSAGHHLTQREGDVLSLLALGYPNSEIAANLFISAATVRSHVLNILRKLGVRNRTEAVALAYRRGLFAYRGPVAMASG